MPPRTSHGPLARDFEAYYAGGATWNAGGDPWTRDVWSVERTLDGVIATRDEVLPFVGPAASLPLWSLLARLPHPAALAVWWALLALAFAVLVGATVALVNPHADGLAILAAGVLALASGPLISDLTLGQVALVSAAGCAAALLAFDRRSAWAVPATLLSALQPNLALPLASLLTNRRAFVWIGTAVLIFLALTFGIGGGAAGLLAYARHLLGHGEAERFVSIQHTIPVILASFGVSRANAIVAGTAVAMTVAGSAAAAALRFRHWPQLAAAIAIALLPLSIPFFHEHDFILEIIPVIILLSNASARVRGVSAIAAVAILVDWFGLAQRQSAQPQTAALALAVAFAVCAYGARRRLRARDLAPVAVAVALLAVAVPLARAFPSPTWPEALSLTFHADPRADVTAVWAQEQSASGLDRDVWGWGVLRAIPLAGCLLLAGAGVLAARAGTRSDIDVHEVVERSRRVGMPVA